MVLITVVGAPPVEELTFRGLLMHSFPHQDQPRWRWLSGAIGALLFGLAHTGFTDPLNLLIYTGLGAVFTAVYAVTGDLRYSIGLHFLNNLAALFL
nr:CPBP family intramembrane glutamic endopeptidase [Lacticaseibacillus absianus]